MTENNKATYENENYRIEYRRDSFPIDGGDINIVQYNISDKQKSKLCQLNLETGRRMDPHSPRVNKLDAKLALIDNLTGETISMRTSGDNIKEDITSIEGLMDVYAALKQNKFKSYNASNEENAQKAGKILETMDTYIFNTPEARIVLREHLAAKEKQNVALNAAIKKKQLSH